MEFDGPSGVGTHGRVYQDFVRRKKGLSTERSIRDGFQTLGCRNRTKPGLRTPVERVCPSLTGEDPQILNLSSHDQNQT